MTDKTAPQIIACFEDIFKEMGTKPKKIWVDQEAGITGQKR